MFIIKKNVTERFQSTLQMVNFIIQLEVPSYYLFKNKIKTLPPKTISLFNVE